MGDIFRRKTIFHDIVAWSKLAEICAKYLKKSKLVYLEGYLKTRSWDTPEGVKKYRTEIVIYDMIMLEKRPIGEELPSINTSPDSESAATNVPEEDLFNVEDAVQQTETPANTVSS